MSKINSLIEDFSTTNLIAFLRASIPSFKPDDDDLDHLFQEDIYDKYESIVKIGEAEIDKDELIVIASKTNEPLTERTGKKNQYEIAKTILKHEVKDASLFVFYDDEGNFRFSFVRANYLGTKRDFTDFKRYTYFVTPSQTNKTFIKQVGSCNFNSLDEIIQAFSVEPLNKQFYQDIAKSFYGLIGGKVKIGSRNVEFDTALKLPSTPVETNRKIYQEFAVRLIGRTIFCWFLKSKKSENSIPLVPESWLSSKTVVETNNEKHNYYHSVLEKLFFLVLNKKQADRKDYELPNDQELIPFLNGGLFEAKADDFFPTNSKGIHQIAFDLKIPNQWFIELFEVLEQYNFTIDENSIYDAEVSIDPEMLGTIFENLLAEIDPDTEKSARKATGSFYTPREIVDYMVEQSLVQYLKTKVSTENEEQLLELFKEGGENQFESTETKKILEALSDVKILDPACGSGAFPMGALHKIINALQKLDPDASWWKEKQIANVPNALAKQMLKEKLDGESADYVRKLGVIQNSIYGVDIQPIASEISKLRSFLSLVIDETIIDEAENRGIQALPNLEFKFVTANSLIGLTEEKNQQIGLFDNFEELQLLKQLRSEYLQSSGSKKLEIKERFLKVQKKAFKNDNNLFTDVNSRSFLITSWNPFKNEPSSWFDPKWMFGINNFDIVIGNPPYIGQSGNKETFRVVKKSSLGKLYHQRRMDYFYFFFHSGIQILKEKGVLTFITTNYFFNATYADKLRQHINKECQLANLVDFNEVKVFESAQGQHNAITTLIKTKEPSSTKYIYCDRKEIKTAKELERVLTKQDKSTLYAELPSFEVFNSNEHIDLKSKFSKNNLDKPLSIIEKSNYRISDFFTINQGVVTGGNKVTTRHLKSFGINASFGDGIFILSKEEISKLNLNDREKEYIKPWFKNSNVNQYKTDESTDKFLIYYTSFNTTEFKEIPNLLNHFERFKELLVNRNVRTGKVKTSEYDDFVSGKSNIDYVMIKSTFQSGNFFAVSYAREQSIFERPKIVCPQRSNINTFGYNEIPWFGASDLYFINSTTDSKIHLKILLIILNSGLIYKWLYYKGQRKGKMLQLFKDPLCNIPIVDLNNLKHKKELSILADIIIFKATSQNLKEIVDSIVLELYFQKHMKEKEINILEFLVRDMNQVLQGREFFSLNLAEKEIVIEQLLTIWNHSDNQVRNRINLFSVRSPEILRPIVES